jgi:hypothetical protein
VVSLTTCCASTLARSDPGLLVRRSPQRWLSRGLAAGSVASAPIECGATRSRDPFTWQVDRDARGALSPLMGRDGEPRVDDSVRRVP